MFNVFFVIKMTDTLDIVKLIGKKPITRLSKIIKVN